MKGATIMFNSSIEGREMKMFKEALFRYVCSLKALQESNKALQESKILVSKAFELVQYSEIMAFKVWQKRIRL